MSASDTPTIGPWRAARRLVAVGVPPWGRLALAALLGVAGALATVGLLAGSAYVIDRAAFRPGLGAIAGVLAAVEVLAFIRGPLRYGERLLAHDAAFSALSRWRVWLYDQLEPRAPAALAAWRGGDLLSRATDDIDALQDLYLRALLPVVTTVAAATLAVVLVALALPAAAVVLGIALAVAVLATPPLALAAGPGRGREARVRGVLAAEVVDLVRGAPELVAFGAEQAVLDRLDALDAELTTLARRRALAAGAVGAVLTLCVGAAVIGTLATGVAALSAHHLEPVMLGVLPLAAIASFETVPALALAALRTREVLAAGRRLLEIEDVPIPVVDPPVPLPVPQMAASVALDDAHLRYRADLPWALEGATIAIEPLEHMALIGASGAGKSSVVNVLLRFWPLSRGTASLGGVDLEHLAQADVRRAIALVDQDARLFAGSIRHNVTLGRPEASDAEVEAAIRLAQLEGWVDSLPEGLGTAVGEGGAQVSGGQRQRIALARALLMPASVLVLDEPTAGLDLPTAARLLTDVRAASAERSVLLVTHRREDLSGFDRVVVLEDGRVTTDEAFVGGERAGS